MVRSPDQDGGHNPIPFLKAAERVLVFGSGRPSDDDPTHPIAPFKERAPAVLKRHAGPGIELVPSLPPATRSIEMRTYLLSALTIATFGFLALSPASAENAPWECMSPAFACGGAPAAKSHRSHEFAGERTNRRQASSKRKQPRVAKHETTKAKTEAKQQAKVELPEKKQQAKIETPAVKVVTPDSKQQQAAKTPADAKAPVLEKKPEVAVRKVEPEHAYRVTSSQAGMASYYGSESGSQTASGQRFNPGAMTAAHRSLPFGTKVRVTNKRNGKSVVVTINDRGPFVRGRIIDLSTAAAGVIGMRSSGVAPVVVERIATN
jgi:rare lipoprotein A